MKKKYEDWVKKCMEIRVEARIPRKTWLESVEGDMVELEIDRQNVPYRKKWRNNVMKRKFNPIRKRTMHKPIIIILHISIQCTYMIYIVT